MNERFLPDIHGLYKRNKKKTISRKAVEERVHSNIENMDFNSPEEIKNFKAQSYGSQYVFGHQKYKDFIVNTNNSVTILNSKTYEVARNTTVSMKGMDPILKSITPLVNDIQDHLKKKQTGKGLIDNTIDINLKISSNPTRMSTSLSEVMDSVKKFDKNKEFLYFDTETFSGQNEYGYQTLLGMQEFSLTKYKKVGEKVQPVKGSKIEALFGLDETSVHDLEKINIINKWIDELEDTGEMPGHSLADVTLKRLAVEGHDDTKIDYGADGIVRVTGYASPKAMKGKELNVDLIRKGLEKEKLIGAHQREFGRIGADVLGDESISASTFEFFRYIQELNNNLVISKNGIMFDAKVLKQEAEARYSGLTDKQRQYIADKLGVTDFHKLTFKSGHIDQENLFKLAYDTFGEKRYFTEDQLEYAQSIGLTSRSLEGIIRMLYEDIVYGDSTAAHTAGTDTFAGAMLAAGDYKNGKSFMETIIGDLQDYYGKGSSIQLSNNVIKTKSGEALTPIFIAKKSDQFDSSPLDFTYDELTGDIHFGNKKILRADGSVSEAVYAPATKANVPYEIQVNKINPTDEMLSKMQQVGDFYKGADDLFLVSYIPQIDSELAQGNTALISPIHRIVQGMDKIQANISNNMIYAFNRDAAGNYRELSVEDGVTEEAIQYAKENLAIHTTVDGKRIVKQTTAQEKITKGTFDLMNDPAAREIRNTDLKKAKAFLRVRDELAKQGYASTKEMKSAIGELLSKAVASGTTLSLDKQEQMKVNQLIAMVGYRSRETGNYVLHPGTFKNFYNTFDLYSSMGGVLDQIVELSEAGGLSSDTRYKEYVRNLRENIAGAIEGDERIREQFVSFMGGRGMNKTADEIVNGMTAIEDYGYATNKFHFNIPANNFNYYNKNVVDPEDVFTMNLEPGKHYAFINNLLNRHYGADRVKGMNAATKEALGKKAIIDFMYKVNSTEEYEGMFDGIINSIDSQVLERIKTIKSNFEIPDKAIAKQYERIKEIKLAKKKYMALMNEVIPEKGKSVQEMLSDFLGRYKELSHKPDDWMTLSFDRIAEIKSEHLQMAPEFQELKAKRLEYINEAFGDLDVLNKIVRKKQSINDVIEKEYEILRNFKGYQEHLEARLEEELELLDKTEILPRLNSVSLAAEAQRAVKKFKDSNPTAGLSNKTDLLNVISDSDLIAFANTIEEGTGIIESSLSESTELLKNKVSKVISGKEVDREAARIVDTVLNNVYIGNKKVSDISKIAKHASEVYGYTEKNIAIRVKHNRQSQIDMVKSIIGAVHSIEGGSVLYNNNQIGIKIGNSEVVDITKYLPIMNFENGILFNTLNNSNLAAGEMLSVAHLIGADGESIERSGDAIKSTLDRGFREIKYLKNRIKTKDTDTSKIDTIVYSLKRMGTNLRETSQVSIGNTFTEAINSVRRLDMSEVQLAIPALMKEIERSPELTRQQKDVLIRNKEMFKKMSSDAEYDQIAAEVEPIIARMVLGVSQAENFDENIDSHYLLKNFNLYTRDTQYQKFERAAGENEISAFQQLSNYKKPPIHQRRNAKLYRTTDIARSIDTNKAIDNTFQAVSSKNRIVTSREQKLTNRTLSGIIESTDTIMANRLDIDDKTFKERLLAYKEELIKKGGKLSAEQEEAFKIASSMNLFEQEKIVSSRISQVLFNDNDTQFINADGGIINTLINKEKDVEVANKLFEKQVKTVPIINVDKNGKVTFKYGDKQIVSKHETLFTRDGFGGTIDSIGANFDGLLSFRYYSANVALSEKEITDFLNEANVATVEEALEKLNSRFKGRFAVENSIRKGMNKLYVDVEKGMGRSLEVGAGKINKDIATVLKKVGLEDKINSFIKDEYLLEVLKNTEGLDEILEESKFTGVDDLLKAIEEERHIVNDLVQEAFGNKGIAVFTNDAKIKHESLDMAIKDMLNTAAYKIASESGEVTEDSMNAAYKKVFDVVKKSKALAPYIDRFDSKTGQIITKSIDDTGHVLTLEGMRDVAEKLGMISEDGKILFGIQNEHGGQLVHSSFTVAGPSEYAGESGSQGRLKTIGEEIKELSKKKNITEEEKLRLSILEKEKRNAVSRNKLLTIDQRASRTLDRQSYNVTNKLNELNRSLGSVVLNDENTLFDKYFGEMTESDSAGNVVLKEGVNDKTNAYLLDELKEKARYNEELEYLGGGYKKLDESYIRNLDPDDERHIIYDKYFGDDKKPISRNYAELAHASEQSREALIFNGGKGGVTEEILKEKGYVDIDINDLVQPVGSGSAKYVGQEGVPEGRSFLLNITDKEGEVSKIAVPYMPARQVGDELINTELNKAVKSVAYANKELQDFRAGHLAGNATEAQLQERLDTSIENLRFTIKNSAQEVEKQLNSVELGDYKYNKGSGILFHKSNKALNSDFYNTATFDGVTLGELAERGIYIPAAATGIDVFESAGYLDESYYSKLGYKTREEMIEHLETKGVVGLLGRNPQTEDMSTSLGMMYLDKSRNSKEIKVTMEYAFAKNADFDGDNFTLALIEGGANQQRLHELKKSILADTIQLKAVRENVLEPKIQKEFAEATSTFEDIFRESASGAKSDMFISMVDRNISAKQVNEYRTITQGLINNIGSKEYRTYDFDQSFDALMNAAKTVYTEGSEEYNTALKAINFSMAETKQVMANISSSSKKDIGYMDTPLTELEGMADALQMSADEMKSISAISKVMKEAPISKKHDASAELSITNRYRKAWQSAMSGSEQGAQEVIEIMSTMKSDIIKRANTTELAFSGLADMTEDEAFEMLVKPVRRILDAGQTTEGQQAYLSQKKINEMNAAAHRAQTRGSIFGETIAELTGKTYINEEKLSHSTNIKSSFEGFERANRRVVSEGAEALQTMAVNSSGLAKAALGVAAAVMMTGYIGGNPSVAPGREAEELNQYDSLQDEDLSIQQLPQGGGQGYVININAQSDKGQEHAMQAIQKAMYSSVTTDINISMNINDRTSNISSRFIDSLLSGAL